MIGPHTIAVLFNTAPFLLGFLPLTMAGFFLAGRLGGTEWALRWIVAASLVFYGWWDARFVALLAGSIVANYAIGQRILGLARARRDGAARRWLLAGVALDLGLLGWFKYAGFLARAAALAGLHAPSLEVALPLAISFFTFQQIMFLADSARADRPDAGFGAYAAFVAFFPHLIAGPIVRSGEIIPQLTARDLARPRAEAVAEGLEIFLLGLAKKAVLADTFARFADVGFDAAARGAPLTLFEAWYALAAYGLQIYFDFSGYSGISSPPECRPAVDETCGTVFRPAAERSVVIMVRTSPRISWTRGIRSTPDCARGREVRERVVQTCCYPLSSASFLAIKCHPHV